MERVIKVFLLSLLVALVPRPTHAAPASACTIFVATDGSDSNNGRDIAHPLASWQTAANLTVPGDVVCARGGTYRGSTTAGAGKLVISRSGADGQPITYQSYPGERAVIDGSAQTPDPNRDPGSYGEMILIKGDYIVFRDVEISRAAGVGLRTYYSGDSELPRHAVIEDLISHGNYGAGIHVYGRYHLIQRNTSYHNCDFGKHAGNHSDGIGFYLGGNHVVRDNLVYENSDDGIDLYRSMYNEVYRNVSHHNGNVPGVPSGWQCTADGAGFKSGGAGHPEGGQNLLYNNIAYGNTKYGFHTYASGGTKFYHNTSHGNGKFGMIVNRQYDSLPNILRNNILYGNPLKDLTFYLSGTLQEIAPICTHNVLVTTDYSGCTETVSSDPTFQDGAGHDYHLRPESPAIDHGIDLRTLPDGFDVPVDFDGIARPQGVGYDIGAFEYVTGGGEPSPPAPPNSLRRTDVR